MSLPKPRPQIAAIPAYVPGARGAADRQPPIKLSSNESPYPPLPSVSEAIARAGQAAHRYPDMFAVQLHKRIGEELGLAPGSVAVGGGSVAALQHVLQAFTGPGDEVMFAWRSFEAYPIITAVTGATPVTVPLTADARHDLAAMAAAIAPATKVVVLCSPNNPTGPAIRTEEFDTFMAAVPEHVLVVLDEAYIEFATDPATVDGRAALDRYPNLLIARTFSKAYGLAGLRVGYVVGAPPLITPVSACVTPFSVSAPAQAAALASLDARDELLERVAEVVADRAQLVAGLEELGWHVPHAQGNFVWLATGERTDPVVRTLADLEPAVLVRGFSGEGIRITVGSRAENEALIRAVDEATARA